MYLEDVQRVSRECCININNNNNNSHISSSSSSSSSSSNNNRDNDNNNHHLHQQQQLVLAHPTAMKRTMYSIQSNSKKLTRSIQVSATY